MGKLIVFVGASASGKTLIKKSLINMLPNQFNSLITVTTRDSRKGEKNNIDYHFMSIDEFNWRAHKGEFAEQTEYAGEKYGVLKDTLDEILDEEKHSVAAMSADGVFAMKEFMGEENVISIYVDVSLQTIINRLKAREISKDEIEKRIRKAENEEITDVYKNQFNFILNNNDKSVEELVNCVVKYIKEFIN
jgi:guanylate kinase